MTASIVNKTFKSIVAASAALIMAASVAACGPSAATPSDEGSTGSDSSSSSSATARTLDEIKKSGKLKVAVFSDKAPFGYVDKDGNYAGYDVYFAERLGKDLGVDVEYTSVDAAARVDVLTSNKVDITLANFTVTDERKEKVDFAKPYMKVALGVVSPENAEITDVDQLKGKTLIVTKGTTAETFFEKNYPDIKLQKYDQYADAYNALLDGRGDAFSTDNTEVLAWAKSNKGFKVGITELGDKDTIAAAVQKGNKELLDWINDEIDKLRLAATSALLSGRKDVVVVSSVSCIYGMGNPADFYNNVIDVQQGKNYSRNVFLRRLVDSLYVRNDIDLNRGNFRVKGDTVDIYLAYADNVLRIVFCGDNIDSMEEVDAIDGVTMCWIGDDNI